MSIRDERSHWQRVEFVSEVTEVRVIEIWSWSFWSVILWWYSSEPVLGKVEKVDGVKEREFQSALWLEINHPFPKTTYCEPTPHNINFSFFYFNFNVLFSFKIVGWISKFTPKFKRKPDRVNGKESVWHHNHTPLSKQKFRRKNETWGKVQGPFMQLS